MNSGQQLTRLKTTTLHDTLNPMWNESVCFPLTSDRDFLILHIWCHDPIRQNEFMGEVRVPWWEYEDSAVQKTWFELTPRKDGKYKDCPVGGAVFIQFIYHLRPAFNPTTNIILQSPLMPKLMNALLCDDLILATVLFENLERTKTLQTREGSTVVKSILTLFQNQSFNSTMNLLRVRIKQEVSRTKSSSNLFRANTAATVLLTQYVLQVGQRYLEQLLRPLLNKLVASTTSCEIDPKRLGPNEDLAANQAHLVRTCEEFLTAILESLGSLPPQFRWVAHILALEISKASFDDKDDAIRVSIASLYFLRFVCPAIVDPARYKLVDKTPGTMARRSLILVAKVLQNIANVGSSATFYVKEEHMGAMLGILEANAERVAHFFEALTVVSASRVRLTFENLDATAREEAMANVLSYAKQHRDDIRKTILTQLENLPRSKEFRRRASFLVDTDSPRQGEITRSPVQRRDALKTQADRKRGVSTPQKPTDSSVASSSSTPATARSLCLHISTPSSSSSICESPRSPAFTVSLISDSQQSGDSTKENSVVSEPAGSNPSQDEPSDSLPTSKALFRSSSEPPRSGRSSSVPNLAVSNLAVPSVTSFFLHQTTTTSANNQIISTIFDSTDGLAVPHIDMNNATLHQPIPQSPATIEHARSPSSEWSSHNTATSEGFPSTMRLLTPSQEQKHSEESPGPSLRRSSASRRPLPAFHLGAATPPDASADAKTEVTWVEEANTQQNARASMVTAVIMSLDLHDCAEVDEAEEEVPQVAHALSLFAPTQELLEEIWAVATPTPVRKKAKRSFKKRGSLSD